MPYRSLLFLSESQLRFSLMSQKNKSNERTYFDIDSTTFGARCDYFLAIRTVFGGFMTIYGIIALFSIPHLLSDKRPTTVFLIVSFCDYLIDGSF